MSVCLSALGRVRRNPCECVYFFHRANTRSPIYRINEMSSSRYSFWQLVYLSTPLQAAKMHRMYQTVWIWMFFFLKWCLCISNYIPRNREGIIINVNDKTFISFQMSSSVQNSLRTIEWISKAKIRNKRRQKRFNMHRLFLVKEEGNGLRSHAVQHNSRLQYILQTVSFLTFLPSLNVIVLHWGCLSWVKYICPDLYFRLTWALPLCHKTRQVFFLAVICSSSAPIICIYSTFHAESHKSVVTYCKLCLLLYRKWMSFIVRSICLTGCSWLLPVYKCH